MTTDDLRARIEHALVKASLHADICHGRRHIDGHLAEMSAEVLAALTARAADRDEVAEVIHAGACGCERGPDTPQYESADALLSRWHLTPRGEGER